MEYVVSTNISRVGYDPDALELHVEFASNAIYVYSQVPGFVYDEFMAAPSKGSYFNRHIKDVYTAGRL